MLLSTDIQFLLSAPQAGGGYLKPGSPGNSLGLYVSTTQLSGTPMDNLFTDLGGAQNAADQVDYACVFIFNNNKTGNTMLDVTAWLPSADLGVDNGATFAIGADPTPPSVLGSSIAQAVAIQNPVMAPAGVSSWSAPTSTSVGGVPIPNIAPGYVAAVWIRRTANGQGGLNSFVVEVTCDTLG